MNCELCFGMGRLSDPELSPPFKTCHVCSGTGLVERTPETVALPAMNVSSPVMIDPNQRAPLVQASAENLGKMCEQIMTDIGGYSEQIDDVLKNFIDMVMNEGDSSGSTKEAVVNLIKTKSDLADKKIKVMDLMMRSYLKETNTMPKVLAATQNNKFYYQNGGMRGLIGEIKKERDESKQ